MKPNEKVLWLILAKAAKFAGEPAPAYPLDNAEELYDALVEAGEHWDAVSEVRCCGINTGLQCPWSRHYESEAVAQKLPDGSWVGWTYWHGGGKHGEPEAIAWIDDAYNVTCKEEEKLVVVQTFSADMEQTA